MSARAVDKVKERPKVGDCVKFRARGVRIGTVVGVSKETNAHFLIETPFTAKMRRKPWESELKLLRIGIDAIIQILPKEQLIKTKNSRKF